VPRLQGKQKTVVALRSRGPTSLGPLAYESTKEHRSSVVNVLRQPASVETGLFNARQSRLLGVSQNSLFSLGQRHNHARLVSL
jgi:hypothetical protein